MHSKQRLPLLALSALLLLIIRPTFAILNGDPMDWNRNGYLVKVLGRSEGRTISCSGTMISSALVLTSASCTTIKATDEPMDEYAVVLSKLGKEQQHYYSGTLLETSATWALLQIEPQNLTEICPPGPAPKRISRLNQKPSMLSASTLDIDPMALNKYSCHMIGFETTTNASDFLNQHKVLKLGLEKFRYPVGTEKFHRTSIFTSTAGAKFTACFDDTGAALFCHVAPHGEIQVGLFQSLSVMEDETLEKDSLDMCTKATDMEFAIITADERLVQAIQKHHHFSEFVASYTACKFLKDQNDKA